FCSQHKFHSFPARRSSDLKDKVYQQLVDEFKVVKITWEELLQDYMNEFKHNCVPFAHLTEMLEALKRCKLALGMITNGFGQFQIDRKSTRLNSSHVKISYA